MVISCRFLFSFDAIMRNYTIQTCKSSAVFEIFRIILVIFRDPRKENKFVYGGGGAPEKSMVKIVAKKEKLQIKNTFLLSNLSENTSSDAYLA